MILWLRLWLFRILGGLLEHLPERVDVALSRGIFSVVGVAPQWRRSSLRANVAAALAGGPDHPADDEVVDRMLARSLQSYGRYWAEGAKLPAMHPGEVTARIRFSEGGHYLRDALAEGRGVVLALPHIGSWEWGGMFLADIGWPMTAVAERLEPPALFEWFADKRERMGLGIVPLDDKAGGKVATLLRGGALVGLLCDRDVQDNGIDVELFGRRTTVPAGPATLALRTGAALMCCAVYSGPGRDHHIVVTPPIDTARRGSLREDVSRISQVVTDELGWLIRRAPEQWHVLQPIWPASR